jgi:cell division protein FtsB
MKVIAGQNVIIEGKCCKPGEVVDISPELATTLIKKGFVTPCEAMPVEIDKVALLQEALDIKEQLNESFRARIDAFTHEVASLEAENMKLIAEIEELKKQKGKK